MENYNLKSSKEIKLDVESTCSYVNKMYFISMSLHSKELKKVLNNFENFEKTFSRISKEQWGAYSDKKELPQLLELSGYNGWLVEVFVPQRDHLKISVPSQVERKKFIYCHHFNDIIPSMLEFAKDVLEEDIIEFNLRKNAR